MKCGHCERERAWNGDMAEIMTFGPVRWRVSAPDFEEFSCDQHLRGMCDRVADSGHAATVTRVRRDTETPETWREVERLLGDAADEWHQRTGERVCSTCRARKEEADMNRYARAFLCKTHTTGEVDDWLASQRF